MADWLKVDMALGGSHFPKCWGVQAIVPVKPIVARLLTLLRAWKNFRAGFLTLHAQCLFDVCIFPVMLTFCAGIDKIQKKGARNRDVGIGWALGARAPKISQ